MAIRCWGLFNFEWEKMSATCMGLSNSSSTEQRFVSTVMFTYFQCSSNEVESYIYLVSASIYQRVWSHQGVMCCLLLEFYFCQSAADKWLAQRYSVYAQWPRWVIQWKESILQQSFFLNANSYFCIILDKQHWKTAICYSTVFNWLLIVITAAYFRWCRTRWVVGSGG